jgi:hypothetical protein
MLRLFRQHGAAESAYDLRRTMDTVGPEPVWECYPQGLRIVGRAAVSELYSRIFSGFLPLMASSSDLTVAYGECHIVLEHRYRWHGDLPDEPDVRSVTVMTFEDGLVQSERIYMDHRMAASISDALGADFASLPGVACGD